MLALHGVQARDIDIGPQLVLESLVQRRTTRFSCQDGTHFDRHLSPNFTPGAGASIGAACR